MNRLTNSRLLLALLTVFIGLIILISVLENHYKLKLLDSIPTVSKSNRLLQTIGESQRCAHIGITLILDTVFPFVYGLLLIGATMKLYPHNYLAWLAPAVIVIPMDLLENLVHLTALLSHEPVMPIKGWLTPAKWVLIVVAILIVIVPGALRTVALVKRRTSH